MTELEKLDAGLEYDFWDPGVNGRKLDAIKFCRELRKMQDEDAAEDEQAVLIQKYFGSVGRDVCLCPGFMCDNGKNIHVGDQFLANYNVTILDIMPVMIGGLCDDRAEYDDLHSQSPHDAYGQEKASRHRKACHHWE